MRRTALFASPPIAPAQHWEALRVVCRNNLRGERRTESADLKEHTSCEGGARLYSRRVSSAALCAAVFEEEHRKGSRVDFFPAPAPRHVASSTLLCVCDWLYVEVLKVVY